MIPARHPLVPALVLLFCSVLTCSCRQTTTVEIVRRTPQDKSQSVTAGGSVVVLNGVELPHRREIRLRGGTSAARFRLHSTIGSAGLTGRPGGEYDLTAEVWEVTPGDVSLAMEGETVTGKSASGRPFLIGDLSGSLPQEMALDLESVSGDLQVSEFSGFHALRLRSSAGRVKATRLSATREITLETVSGNIEGEALQAGERVSCSSSAGDIGLKSVQTPSLAVETVSGAITIDDSTPAALRCESSAGKVALRRCTGRTVEVKTISGDVELEGVTAERREVRSTAGRVTDR